MSGGRSISLAVAVKSSVSPRANGFTEPRMSTGAVLSTRAVSSMSPDCVADNAETLPATSVRCAE